MKTKDHIGFIAVTLMTALLAVMSSTLAWNSDPGNVNTSPAARILNDDHVLATKSREELIALIRLDASIEIKRTIQIKAMSDFIMNSSQYLIILLVVQIYVWRRLYLSRLENKHNNAG